jgi:hypothetical protein
MADTIFHRIERCRFLSDFGGHRGESSRDLQSSTFYGIKAMSLVSKIIASVIWRPLPIFAAGAMLACLLTLKGPSHVSLALITPSLVILHGIKAIIPRSSCPTEP